MPKIDRSKIPYDNNRSYPKEFASVISGREKQRLGDAVGLTQFGVNVSRIKAHSKSALRHWHESEDEFIYMLEGELVLHEDFAREHYVLVRGSRGPGSGPHPLRHPCHGDQGQDRLPGRHHRP